MAIKDNGTGSEKKYITESHSSEAAMDDGRLNFYRRHIIGSRSPSRPGELVLHMQEPESEGGGGSSKPDFGGSRREAVRKARRAAYGITEEEIIGLTSLQVAHLVRTKRAEHKRTESYIAKVQEYAQSYRRNETIHPRTFDPFERRHELSVNIRYINERLPGLEANAFSENETERDLANFKHEAAYLDIAFGTVDPY